MVWFATNLRRSRVGRALAAGRDSDAAARSLGIDPAHYRLVALSFSAVVAALGGILLAYGEQPLDPTRFAVFLSVQYFLYTVVGGARSLAGAAVVVFAFEVAPALGQGTPPTGPASVLVLGALAVVTVAFVPGGLAGLVQRAAGRLRPGSSPVPALDRRGRLGRVHRPRSRRPSGWPRPVRRRRSLRRRCLSPVPARAAASRTSSAASRRRGPGRPGAATPAGRARCPTAAISLGDAGTATDRPETGELFWRPFNPKALERTRPFRTAPPSRDEFESHLSQFLGTRTKRTGPLFRAQGVTVRYGAVAACTDVDLELNDGEIVAVIGPNGAGKTALCDALSGFSPSTGRVYLGERDVSGLPAHERSRLGMARMFSPPGAVRIDDGGRERDGGPASPDARRLLLLRLRPRPVEAGRPAGPAARPRAARAPRYRGPRRPAGGRPGPRASSGWSIWPGRWPPTPAWPSSTSPPPACRKLDRKDLAERIGMVCDEMGIAVLVTGQDFPAIANLADFVYVLDTGAVVGQGEPDEVADDTRVQAAFLRGVQPVPARPDRAKTRRT